MCLPVHACHDDRSQKWQGSHIKLDIAHIARLLLQDRALLSSSSHEMLAAMHVPVLMA